MLYRARLLVQQKVAGGLEPMSLFDQDRSSERIPVSVITGYLGSGKTTLLNRLLRHPGMGDSAVIINEFGEVPLDHHLVEAVAGEIAVMASGCVCCTMRSDLAETLRGLLARRDAGEIPLFRRVLIETTGLADPAPIVQLLLNNPMLNRFVRLDAIATTVDAVHGMAQLDEEPEPAKQAAIADRLLLTKTDLANADEIARLRERLRGLNPGARLHTVLHGEIDPEKLFGAGLFDPSGKPPDVRAWINEPAYDGAAGPHQHHHGAGVHDARVRAFCLSFDVPLEWGALSEWLARLRRWHGEHLLRVKGILNLAGEAAPVAIHGVHHVFHPPVQLRAWPDADRRSRIVFITRDLGRAALEESLREAMPALAKAG
jgi:G3E family GTPase